MLKTMILIILTLVLISASASERSEAPLVYKDEINKNTHSEDLLQKKGLVITRPQISDILSHDEKFEIYKYRQSISPRFLIAINSEKLKSGKIPIGLGFSYLIPETTQPQWELGADLFTEELSMLNITKRKVLYPDNYFRPYYKYGLAHQWKASEKLASFGNWKNYLLKLSIGFEEVIKLPMSTRIEIEIGLGTEESILILSLGYSWAW